MTCTVPSTKRRRRLDRRRRRHAARTRNFRDSPRPPVHVNAFPVAAAKIWNAPPDIVGRSSLTVDSSQNFPFLAFLLLLTLIVDHVLVLTMYMPL